MGIPGRPSLTLSYRPDYDVRVDWEPVNSTPGVYQYQYQIGVINGNWDTGVITRVIEDTQTSFIYEHPTGGTIRYYRVRARNADGWGPWSSTARFHVPTKPSKPTITLVQYTAPRTLRAICSESTAEGDLSAITGYKVRFSYDENFSDAVYGAYDDIRDITFTSPSSRLGQRVYFTMSARNIRGYGPESNVQSYLLAPGPRVLVDGEWRNTVAYVNVDGVWRPAIPFVNYMGVWKTAAQSN